MSLGFRSPIALTTTAEQLSSRFGRKNKNRPEQIEGILEKLKGLGKIRTKQPVPVPHAGALM